MRRFGVVAICVLLIESLCGCLQGDAPLFDASRVTLLQTAPLMEGEDIAVFTTESGEFRMRFFPSEAPLAVENFLSLAREGAYDNTTLFSDNLTEDEPDVLSGGVPIVRVNGNKPFPPEVSANLWHFSGAVSVLENKHGKGDGRFFITGSSAVPESLLTELDQQNYPDAVLDAFRLYGGTPAYSLSYSVFGQIIEGQDVVDSLISLSDEEDVILQSVSIEVYHTADEANDE